MSENDGQSLDGLLQPLRGVRQWVQANPKADHCGLKPDSSAIGRQTTDRVPTLSSVIIA